MDVQFRTCAQFMQRALQLSGTFSRADGPCNVAACTAFCAGNSTIRCFGRAIQTVSCPGEDDGSQRAAHVGVRVVGKVLLGTTRALQCIAAGCWGLLRRKRSSEMLC